jgi:hypothetical protein
LRRKNAARLKALTEAISANVQLAVKDQDS